MCLRKICFLSKNRTITSNGAQRPSAILFDYTEIVYHTHSHTHTRLFHPNRPTMIRSNLLNENKIVITARWPPLFSRSLALSRIRMRGGTGEGLMYTELACVHISVHISVLYVCCCWRTRAYVICARNLPTVTSLFRSHFQLDRDRGSIVIIDVDVVQHWHLPPIVACTTRERTTNKMYSITLRKMYLYFWCACRGCI